MQVSRSPQELWSARRGFPLQLAAQGYFWVGSEVVDTPDGPGLRGQTYVEYWIPEYLRHPFPIVMIHGGGGQGLDYLGTGDGREGWAHWFVRQGYAVYVVDRPCHGRSPFHPDIQGEMMPLLPSIVVERLFSRPSTFEDNWPKARLHNKWPGSGTFGDPAFESFLASAGPMPASMERHHQDAQRGGAELLDQIGPAILLTHSAGGPVGWMMLDARPSLVKGIVAVEPVGPPFAQNPDGKLNWGVTAAQITFDPPVESFDQFELEERLPVRPDNVACLVQKEPARQLPHFRGVPIVVVTAEASWMAADNHGTVDFLAQAGASVEHLRLEDNGIHGNGHAMMLETNSDEIAGLIANWIDERQLS